MGTSKSGHAAAERSLLIDRLDRLPREVGLSTPWLLLSFVVASIAIFGRCAGLFTHAQFYAEDGALWYAQAYNGGWLHSLTVPVLGYLNTLQRLIAGIALLMPFRWAPLTMTVAGLFWQALPVPILLSRRCRDWGSLPLRMAFAAIYIAIPNAREIHVVCTNCQWHLAVTLGLLAFAAPPEGFPGRLFDIAIFSIAAAGGPFGIFILPLVGVFYYRRRQRWTAVVFSILGIGTIVQLIVLLNHYSDRNRGHLGATLALFIRLLGGNAFIGTLLGSRSWGLICPLAVSAFVLILGSALCIYCARCSGAAVQMFFIYCFLIFFAGIRSPGIEPVAGGLWPALLQIPSQRYVFFPGLAFLFAVLWSAGFARNRAARWTGIALSAVLCVGIWSDWRIPPMPRFNMLRASNILKQAKPGERVVLPINPQPWFMVLIKK